MNKEHAKFKSGDKVVMKTTKEILASDEYKSLSIGKPYIKALCDRFSSKTLTIDEWVGDIYKRSGVTLEFNSKYTTKECDLFFGEWLFIQE